MTVDDVIADVLVVAWTHASKVRPGAEQVWLRAVSTRVIANQQRTLRRQARRHSPDDPSTRTTVTNPIAAFDDLVFVRHAIDQLRLADQHLIVLAAAGYSTDELAQALAVSPDVARQRLARARSRLRQHLEHDHHDPGVRAVEAAADSRAAATAG